MSNEVTKSAEEQLKDVVMDVTAEKADKAEVAELKSALEAIEVPSIEGLVKSDELAAATGEVEALKSELAELKTTVMSAPAITKGETMDNSFFKWDGDLALTGNNQLVNKTHIDVTKAFDGTTNITGAPTASQRLYYAMQQMHPFRGSSTIMPISSTAVNLPTVTGITGQVENSVPSSINTGTGHGGNLASATVLPQNWVSVSYTHLTLPTICSV